VSREAKDCILALTVAVAPLVVVGPLTLAGVPAEGPLAWGTFAFYIGGSLLALRLAGRSPGEIGLRRRGLLPSLGLASLLPAGILLYGLLASDLSPREGTGAGQLAERGLYCFLLSGPGQEILFRGLVLSSFRRWQGPAAGLAASSLLYGLAHVRGGPEGMALNALVGAWYGLVVLATRNVWGTAIVHGAHNFLFGSVLRTGGAVL
jgi:membrane protease YdiL (CAAX protease family)